MAHILTASQILDQLWASRERELLHSIAAGRSLDYDSLLSDFGSNFAKSGVKMDLHPEVIGKSTKSSRNCNIPDEERCMARVWNGGKGGRCTRRGCKGPKSDLCGNHARCLEAKGVLPQGRFDDDIPENMLSSGDSSPKSDVEENAVADADLKSGVNEIALDAALKSLVGEDDSVVSPEELSESSSGKKKRGRPKGSKKSKKSENTEMKSEAVEIEEEELEPEVSESDIISALQAYLDGADLKTVTLSSAKKAIHQKLGISKKDYDSKWFKGQLSSMKDSLLISQEVVEKQKIEKQKIEKMEEKVPDSSNSIEEEGIFDEEIFPELDNMVEDDSDSDSEEVACKEIEIDSVKYLLDPETLKVYARESPNGFVGKYDSTGNTIDFDAIDSDDEEE